MSSIDDFCYVEGNGGMVTLQCIVDFGFLLTTKTEPPDKPY